MNYLLNENPYVDSRWKRMKVPCPVCGKIMAERFGNHWWLLRFHNGKSEFLEEEHFTEFNTEEDQYRVYCKNENCSGTAIFALVKERLIAA